MQTRTIVISLVVILVANTIRIKLEHSGPSAAQVDAQVAAMRKLLPRKVDEMTTQKSVDVNGKTIRFGYDVSATFQTDPATTAAVEGSLRTAFCSSPDAHKLLDAGYTIENVYDVPTPGGTGQFKLVVKPDGCPGTATSTSS
jgi:K+-transporting ATPase A subunit